MAAKPKRRKRAATWSRMVEEAGIAVRVFEKVRGGPLYRSVVVDGHKDRRTLGHRDRALAEQQVRALARELAALRYAGQDGRPLGLGTVFALYERDRLPYLADKRRREARTVMALFARAWGRDVAVADIAQHHVDAYVAQRRSGELAPPWPGRDGRTPDDDPAVTPPQGRGVRDRTIDADLSWLRTCLRWATRYRRNGRRLLAANPLDDVTWPREKNPRRAVASHSRYEATLAHADAVDPTGRLRCLLSLLRYTGRRAGAVAALRASDVLRSPEAVRAALAAAGQDERFADMWPHGAVRWPAETDKIGLLSVAPLAPEARAALDHYLARHPAVGAAWLFPSEADPDAPLRVDVVAARVLAAERAAGLPKLAGTVLHGYRRLFATERKHFSDTDVAALGGWRGTGSLKTAYQAADPATMFAALTGGRP